MPSAQIEESLCTKGPNSKNYLHIQILQGKNMRKGRGWFVTAPLVLTGRLKFSLFSLTSLSDSPHLSCLIPPFLLLSDSDSQPMHGAPVEWEKASGKLLSLPQTSELKASLTSGLWLREMKQCTKHSKWKKTCLKAETGHCALASSKLSKQSQIFVWDILPVLFSCGECFAQTVGCSNPGCSGCCAGFQIRASASEVWAMPHPGILYCVVCV